jgi:UDP-N-acetylmuramoylalanine--D-glutamate ligase
LAKKSSLFKIIKQKDINLKGDFNLLNIMAAIETAKVFQIKPITIKQALKEFKGLPHRLEFVGKHKGIEFYNNSMATIPQTTILDLKTFNEKPITLIVGGSDKGSDYTDLAKEILKTSVKNLVVLGQGTGQKIAEGTRCLRGTKAPSAFQAQTMQEAVKICYERTPKNGVCLLSPASASFNMFKDYQDRGNQFKKYVKILSKN